MCYDCPLKQILIKYHKHANEKENQLKIGGDGASEKTLLKHRELF